MESGKDLETVKGRKCLETKYTLHVFAIPSSESGDTEKSLELHLGVLCCHQNPCTYLKSDGIERRHAT